MAVTIRLNEAAVAIRAASNADAVPSPVADTLQWLFPAAVAIVTEHAPAAPDAVHNAAFIRLLGWMYESDNSDPRVARALFASGAAPLLAQWRVHRAGAVGAAPGTGPSPIPVPAGNIPQPPELGSWILTVDNGVMKWVEFPLP